jgi:hypothetical protein
MAPMGRILKQILKDRDHTISRSGKRCAMRVVINLPHDVVNADETKKRHLARPLLNLKYPNLINRSRNGDLDDLRNVRENRRLS